VLKGVGLMWRRACIVLLIVQGASGCDGILTVYGRVTDVSGAPIPAARVSIYHVGYLSRRTDARGCFVVHTMTESSKHEVPFWVEARGYETYLGALTYPTDERVIVRLPSESSGPEASIEKGASDPVCTSPSVHADGAAAQPAVAADGASPRTD
jgi:hypothetical protein